MCVLYVSMYACAFCLVLMNTTKDDSRKARRSQEARLLGPAERSERRYLRNYDDLDDGIAHGGGGSGNGVGGGGGGGGGGGLGGAGKVPPTPPTV